MPIQVYQAQGGLNRPASNVSNVRVDNSGAIALAKANAGLGNAVLEGAKKLHQAMVTSDIMEANNKYNLEMNKLQGKLFENKEANARNNMTQYEEGRQKILDDIFKNGPSSMRDPVVRQAFMQTADKDWVTQSMRMQNYMIGEEQKHQDTVLLNGYQDCLQNISTAYNNSRLLESYVDKGIGFTRAKFANYGEDKIKLEENKWKAQAYGSAINTAVTNEQWDVAGGILQEHGQYLPPDVRLRMSKAITERKKADIKTAKFQEYADKYKHDIEGAVADFNARNSNTFNAAKGMEFWRGIDGTHRGSNQCANTVSDYLVASGGDQRLITPLADEMHYKAEQAGLAFKDKGELKDGDIVFFATGNYAKSEDPAAIHNGEKDAYHGTDHTGVYNAKTGKVYQSGEHGVSEIPLDYYEVTGFAHPGGRQKTASEMYKEEQELRSFMATKIRQQKQQEDLIFTDSMKNIAGWKSGNMSYDDAMKQALDMAGADPAKISNARSAVNAVYHDEFVKRGNGKTMELGMQYNIENALRVGGFRNKQQLAEYLQRPEVHASAEQFTKIMHMYDDAQAGKGIFKIDKAAVLKEVLGDQKLKGKDKVDAEIAAWAGVLDYVEQQRTQNHRDPSDNIMELAEAGKKAMTKTYYGHQKNGKWFGMADKSIDIPPGLLSAAGIDNRRTYQIDGTNDYVVSFKDGRKPRRMSVVELYNEAYKER